MLRHSYKGDTKVVFTPIAAAAVAFSPFASAQDAGEEDIFELSPFEVKAAEDEGYRAESTLSGSRLNSSLKDTPAMVEVTTLELLEDLGVNDFEELLVYQGNVQTEEFESQGAANSGTFNSSLPNQRNSFRSRGFSGSRTRDFIMWNSPDDVYNVERFDFSKGPNGVLFGVGSIGGTANATTKRAITGKDLTKLELQYGSWDHRRASVDLNKVLIEDKLAIRLNALEQDKGGHRNFQFKDTSRVALAGTFKASKRTSFRFSFEDGDLSRSNHRPFGPSDQFSEWLGEGQLEPSYGGNGRGIAQSGNGIDVLNGNARIVAIENADGTYSAYNWRHSPRSSVYNDKSTDDDFTANYAGRRLYDDSSVFGEYAIPDIVATEGPDAKLSSDWDQLLLAAEHSFSEDFRMEIAYYDETLNTFGTNPGGTEIRVDLVENFGSSVSGNPYREANLVGDNSNYGEFYMENTWRTDSNRKELEGLRATFSYDLDFREMFEGKTGDILGRHRLALLVEKQEELFNRENTFEVFTADGLASFGGTHANPEHSRNRVFRRNYVTFGEWDTFYTGRFPTDMSMGVPMPDGSVTPVETTFVPTGEFAISNDVTDDDIFMIANQSYFMDGRLVTTMGYRVDDLVIDQADSVRDTLANTGVVDYDGDGMVNEWVLLDDVRNETTVKGISRSFGGVFHLNETFSVFSNYSSGRSLPKINERIAPDGRVAPGLVGESYDVGISFDLMDGKISGRLSHFNIDERNRFFFQDGKADQAATRIMDALVGLEDGEGNPLNLISPEEYDVRTPSFNGGLGDGEGKGYELRLVGNMTKNLRFSFNYSYSQRDLVNVLDQTLDWMEAESEYYADVLAQAGLDLDSDLGIDWKVDGSTRNSAQDVLNVVYGNVIKTKAQKSIGFGERAHKANFSGNYTFKEGSLKGFSFGGALRWQDQNAVDAIVDFEDLNGNFGIDFGEAALGADGEPIVMDTVYGTDTFMADLMARYRFKTKFFGEKTEMDLQLNIKNVLDNDDILPMSFNNAFTGYNQYRYQEPRSARVTMRLKF
ncbi:TonB-dependent siderophore receptor [Pelagicoccus mobilis]|uniref:TonB-dependent receptor n=1 Tax=Pelagicoccus mobilis TaxID=415221 RepID=A0A934VPF3_9BACT|nr:TonB-dependent receptor [Pelagicoccus mobilis]MBK1875479.1 TonB-dependent receptor [Pelagicoccus mobilis]